jgi:hypothetical protein
MGEVRGWTLEQRYRTQAPAYCGRFLRQVQPVHIGRLADVLRERLAEGELAEVLLADIILTGRLPTPAGPAAIWVVLEVSTTVDRRDVDRTQRRAALLRQARNARDDNEPTSSRAIRCLMVVSLPCCLTDQCGITSLENRVIASLTVAGSMSSLD